MARSASARSGNQRVPATGVGLQIGGGLCNIPSMKLAALAAVLLATPLVTGVTGCEKQPSKLDQMSNMSNAGVALPSGDLESRVRKLEESLAKREEAFAFLDMVYEQQMEQQTRPTPDGVYAVDIAPNLTLGQIEGSPNALVTIVEAWDFA